MMTNRFNITNTKNISGAAHVRNVTGPNWLVTDGNNGKSHRFFTAKEAKEYIARKLAREAGK